MVPVPPDHPRSTAEAVRSVLFVIAMYALMGLVGIVGLIPALISRRWCVSIMQGYVALMRLLLRAICGLKVEIRGAVPDGPCLVAPHHQSFLDVMVLTQALPQPRFVMKRSILYVPFLGWYARRMGCIAIDRDDKSAAMRALSEGVVGERGQLIIYPQGTRVRPDADAPYMRGVERVAVQTGLPVVLVTTNAGWFWPRRGLRRSGGTAVIEFLGTLGDGQPDPMFMTKMQERLEAARDALSREAAQSFDR